MTMQRRKPLLVTLDATKPSVIELTTQERIQLNRIVSPSGRQVATRHGALIQPGTTRVTLDIGEFCFKALSDTQMQLVQGGVTTTVHTDGKDDWPKPPPVTNKGDDPEGQLPSFTVTEE